MNKMPKEIKSKLRRISKLNKKVSDLSSEIYSILEEYNIYDIDEYTDYNNFAIVTNGGEDDIEDEIGEIEKAFFRVLSRNKIIEQRGKYIPCCYNCENDNFPDSFEYKGSYGNRHEFICKRCKELIFLTEEEYEKLKAKEGL